MATFRQTQIDEILNYERSMNRRILDRTVEQVRMFNEQRAGPSNRDIKFEALISKLLDELKKVIENAVGSIAQDQAPELRGDVFDIILRKKAGEEGFQGPPPNPTTSFLGLEDPKLSAKKQEAAQQQAMADAQAAEQAAGYGVANQSADLLGLGRPRRMRANRKYGGGPGDVHKVQVVRKTEEQLYDIVSKYNGVIDKLLEITTPNSGISSSRTSANSNVQFLSGMLKEILGPLKQLVFELSATQNFELQSMINMFDNMVKIVESSPPFQKINISAYKNAPPNYERFNAEEVVDSKGYLSSLRRYGNKMIVENNALARKGKAIQNMPVKNQRDAEIKELLLNKYIAIHQNYRLILSNVEKDIAKLESGHVIEALEKAQTEAAIKDSLAAARAFRMPPVDADPFAALLPAPPAPAPPSDYELQQLAEFDLNARLSREADDVLVLPDFPQPPNQSEQLPKYINMIGRPYEDATGPSLQRGMGKPRKGKKGGSGGLADYLADPKQQYNRMGRPVSNDEIIRMEDIRQRAKWYANVPEHYTPIGSLYPFYAKDETTKYDFPTRLRKQNASKYPTRDARGADVSLLQGKIGGPTIHTKEPKKPARRTMVSKEEATMNILEGRGKKNKKALHKLAFNDEKNEMFD